MPYKDIEHKRRYQREWRRDLGASVTGVTIRLESGHAVVRLVVQFHVAPLMEGIALGQRSRPGTSVGLSGPGFRLPCLPLRRSSCRQWARPAV